MANQRTTYAAFEQVLLHHEGPQLIVCSFNEKTKLVAVAVDRVSDCQFFGARVSTQQFHDYLDERFDLRFLLSNPDRNAWYKFDLVEDLNRIPVKAADLGAKNIEILPLHGFFARDHSEEYDVLIIEDRSTQQFLVDGNWSMPDFSRFHSQFSDLYALVKSEGLFFESGVDQKTQQNIIRAFTKPYEGGGSYLAAFKGLEKVGGRDAKPDIKAIQWASPGYIQVLANKQAFDKVIEMVKLFGEREKLAIEAYDHLWSYLSEMKLLKKDSRYISLPDNMKEEIVIRGKSLSKELGGISFDEIEKMTGGDNLVTAKVLLATKRRIEKLYRFFSQGRLAVSGISIN